ncbi:variant erythrocyte surface antigen-1 family protein [Babesia caballi]|uniref:Variant erythrocyte surface antigen-1 family protein n=1 Tax=Babesia caballi TaxID=5871 RepID=A0AAV4LUE1_BABCB|nr:variant erythrocyte surface antigen-1 family protein [Babesia caballi]
MTSTVQKKSLIQPPENLKEAIDWVLRVSGRDNGRNDNDAIKDLAEEVIKLLDKDAGEVAGGVLRVMGENLKKVVEGLKKNHSQIPSRGLQGYLSNVKTYFTTVSHYGTAVPEERRKSFIKWLERDATKGTGGPISALADKLKQFMGCKGPKQFSGEGLIDKSNTYTSAYLENTTWANVPETNRSTCALMFLGIVPMLFLFLAYLYWQCTDTKGWKDMTHDESGSSGPGKDDLKMFFEAIGYKNCKINDSKKKGFDIAGFLESAFSELQTAYTEAKPNHPQNGSPSYPAFLGKLQDKAPTSTPSTDSPLSCCHLIASNFFTPNDTYDVKSTSPASPSFAGYSGLTALAGGAYGFNLGGLGTFMSALLA